MYNKDMWEANDAEMAEREEILAEERAMEARTAGGRLAALVAPHYTPAGYRLADTARRGREIPPMPMPERIATSRFGCQDC